MIPPIPLIKPKINLASILGFSPCSIIGFCISLHYNKLLIYLTTSPLETKQQVL
jgi:hypothetical protein